MVSCAAACVACGWDRAADGSRVQAGTGRVVIRVTGSDTMVNLLQAWAERYVRVAPSVVVQVAGGGSGVGFAGLIADTLDVAAASREIRTAERRRIRAARGAEPEARTVALDALAIYVHPANPLEAIALPRLAEIYGEGGNVARWSELGVSLRSCPSDRIVRIGRQNNSGTFAYFRDVVLGPHREYAMGSIDQSGSKDVVVLVSRTPCALGYSGVAYATPGVKVLGVARRPGDAPVRPTPGTVLAGTYPLARPLYLYLAPGASPAVRAFVDWTQGPEGRQIVVDLGFVPPPLNGRPSGGRR